MSKPTTGNNNPFNGLDEEDVQIGKALGMEDDEIRKAGVLLGQYQELSERLTALMQFTETFDANIAHILVTLQAALICGEPKYLKMMHTACRYLAPQILQAAREFPNSKRELLQALKMKGPGH